MKKVLLGTLAVLTLAACSKDEVVQQNPNDAISFDVVTNKAVSRAEDGYCNADKPGDFDVWAKVGSGSSAKNYFAQTNYHEDGGSWVITSTDGVRYWPNNPVDFFAAKNYYHGVDAEHDIVWDPTGANPLVINNYQVESTPGEQTDFIYAVNMEATKATPKATLNFRHALAQIEFMAQNENKKIFVEVTGVKVVNVADKANFTFPVKSTHEYQDGETTKNDNFQDHNQGNDASYDKRNRGTWSLATGTATYEMKATDGDGEVTKEVLGNNTAVALTTEDKTGKEYSDQTLYVMPYDFKATGAVAPWDGTGKPEYAKNTGDSDDYTKHAYFVLTCKIYNVAAGDGTKDVSGVVLYDNDIAVCIPSNTKWEQGKRYVYTFKFTKDGNGGIDTEGKPVFTPITLSVTVDDFANGGVDDPVNMKK